MNLIIQIGTVTVDLITMEPEHLRLKSIQAKYPQDEGPFASSPASPMPITPATDSIPMHVGAENAR